MPQKILFADKKVLKIISSADEEISGGVDEIFFLGMKS
jgi:hypothetical protein